MVRILHGLEGLCVRKMQGLTRDLTKVKWAFDPKWFSSFNPGSRDLATVDVFNEGKN
jgi:hypothetical protein